MQATAKKKQQQVAGIILEETLTFLFLLFLFHAGRNASSKMAPAETQTAFPLMAKWGARE